MCIVHVELYRHVFNFGQRMVFDNVPRHGARCYRERRGQIHLSWTAAAGEVAVLGADDDLIGAGGDAGAGVDAGSAAGFDESAPAFSKISM